MTDDKPRDPLTSGSLADIHGLQHQHRDGTWWRCEDATRPSGDDFPDPALDRVNDEDCYPSGDEALRLTGALEYDAKDHWLVYTDDDGASVIVAYDVQDKWGARIVAAVDAGARAALAPAPTPSYRIEQTTGTSSPFGPHTPEAPLHHAAVDDFDRQIGRRISSANIPPEAPRHEHLWVTENFAGYVDGKAAYIERQRCVRCREWEDPHAED